MSKQLQQEELDPLSSEAMCIRHNCNIKTKSTKPKFPSPTLQPQNLKGSWIVHFDGREDGPAESNSKPQSPHQTSSPDNDPPTLHTIKQITHRAVFMCLQTQRTTIR
jgi:hypothetical protein